VFDFCLNALFNGVTEAKHRYRETGQCASDQRQNRIDGDSTAQRQADTEIREGNTPLAVRSYENRPQAEYRSIPSGPAGIFRG
jgi:hypothetical protein